MRVISSEGRTNYPLTLSVDDDDNSLSLTAQVMSSISAARVCGYMQQALISLSDALTHTPEKSVRTLIVMPSEEREMLLHNWNQTTVNYPPVCCLHELFEMQVAHDGHAIAVECELETLSYEELNTQSNQIAHYLIAKGVRPDDRIALCIKRNSKMLIALLGILKSGAAYVPLDPAYSSQRLTNILQDSEPLFLLADCTGQKALGTHHIPIVDLDQTMSNDLSTDNPDPTTLGLTPSHLAYVIYTSGSTGIPKGVMVEHKNVFNLAHAQSSLFGVTVNSRILLFASISFDVSLQEIVMALTNGACLCLPNDEIRRTDTSLLKYLRTRNVTHAYLPPALIRNTTNTADLKVLQALILGGETPPLSLLQSAISKTVIFNAYGPTEVTMCATTWSCPLDFQNHLIPIGRPLSNIQIYLLDAHGEPVPLGAEGEIYISGAGVARGYLNRPELTAERFLPDSFSDKPSARMYRTGDLARYLPD
ncbi:uncharacterized protein LOC116350201, partial [Contarinia nasturtii]|uniref:uncharacterized protein LOC116350201 n=1 Tax=Contarinia nasturtii TaxID=265458 RepID=UPI0012D4C283